MRESKVSDNHIAAMLEELLSHDQFVLLDTSLPDTQNNGSLLFTNPQEHLQFYPGEDREQFFETLRHWLSEGYYLAGWFGYEFLHEYLDIPNKNTTHPVADLGVYPAPKQVSGVNAADLLTAKAKDKCSDQSYRLEQLLPNMEEQEYCRAINRILEYIAAGDTYQVNYTFKFFFDFKGSVPLFYRDLRRSQPVPYGCFIKNDQQYVLSFSPELFFRVNHDQQIHARPMKGTLKRGRSSEEDISQANLLRNDEKNRSENVMIVDLLRNDLSRLVDATGGGQVNVSSLFDVERYRSVFQMTSSIVADRLRGDRVTPAELLKALFPCGSVTGAPKIRTMQIIEELEKQPRGIYTGAIGYFGPQGESVFNVPIRTVVINDGKGEMGIGSGIVADSSPEDEWQECLLKAKFLTHPLPEFELIETMLYHPHEGFVALEEHLVRMKDSAAYFNIAFPETTLREKLAEAAAEFAEGEYRRVRITLSVSGELAIAERGCDPPHQFHLPDPASAWQGEPVRITFSPEPTNSADPWLYHKTSQRGLYNETYEQVRSQGLFDALFLNERGEVTEGCITNVFTLIDGKYYTPPLASGLLNGTMRRRLLQTQNSVAVHERILLREDIIKADALFVCNAVRGVVQAKLHL